jgi:hypothetical protein
MELTIEQAREYMASHKPFNVVYIAYNVISGEIEKIFDHGNQAWEYAKNRPDIYPIGTNNSIHCPRDIYLKIVPYAQLDFYKDGYLEDEVTEYHKKLVKQILKRENKLVD